MSILEKLSLTEEELTQLAEENTSFCGVLEGYASEVHFKKIVENTPHITHHYKPGDNNTIQKGDRVVTYKGVEISTEVRTILNCKRIRKHQTIDGKTCCDGYFKANSSHLRKLTFSDGSSMMTRNCLIDSGIHIYAICVKPMTGKWDFVYCMTKDLPKGLNCEGTDLQRKELLTPQILVKYPPEGLWTDDFQIILERTYKYLTSL